MARGRYRFGESPYPHFLTGTVVGWLPVFTRPATVAIVLDSLRFLQERGRLRVFGYVILENHLHLIASADDLSKEIGDFKSFTARTILDDLAKRNDTTILGQIRREKNAHKLDRPYQFWQEGSHPQIIETDEVMRQKLGYIHDNPVKRGYVDRPEHWRYSSARSYLGLDGLLPVERDW